jgi:hypothetical protein
LKDSDAEAVHGCRTKVQECRENAAEGVKESEIQMQREREREREE